MLFYFAIGKFLAKTLWEKLFRNNSPKILDLLTANLVGISTGWCQKLTGS